MTVVGKFQINSTDDMVATMKIEMTIGEWRQVKADLNRHAARKNYSATDSLEKVVNNLIVKSEGVFHAREETEA